MIEPASSIGSRDAGRSALPRRMFMCLALLSVAVGVVQAAVGESAAWATTAPGILTLIVLGLPQWLARRIW